MPTSFVAKYRNGDGPVIGLLAEYDALLGLTQDSISERKPLDDRQAGHGCGHNLLGTGSTGAAIILKQWMEGNDVKGEIRLYGCPAEEGGAGKVYLVREGYFHDVDAVLHWHPTDYNGYYPSTHMANIKAKFRFHGMSAHAAASPEKGRSALDGVMVMATAVEFLREHVPDKTRIHYTITNGGGAPNVVPDFAELNLQVRHADPRVVKELWNRILETARGPFVAWRKWQG